MRLINNLSKLLTIVEKSFLFIGFVSFSKIIQQGEDSVDSTTYNLNNALKSNALTVLFATSLMKIYLVRGLIKEKDNSKPALADEAPEDIKKLTHESTHNIWNSIFKAGTVYYALFLDTLKTRVNNGAFIVCPALGMFTCILGHRAYLAFKDYNSINSAAYLIMSVSTLCAAIYTGYDDEERTKISLLAGSGASLILLGNEIKNLIVDAYCETADDSYSLQIDI